MRKKSKYKPRQKLTNPVGYVLQGMVPVRDLPNGYLMKFKIQTSGALAQLVAGDGTREDVAMMIAAHNVASASQQIGYGAEYSSYISDGKAAIFAICARHAVDKVFIVTDSEKEGLNLLVEYLYDWLESITTIELDKAVKIARRNQTTLELESEFYNQKGDVLNSFPYFI